MCTSYSTHASPCMRAPHPMLPEAPHLHTCTPHPACTCLHRVHALTRVNTHGHPNNMGLPHAFSGEPGF